LQRSRRGIRSLLTWFAIGTLLAVGIPVTGAAAAKDGLETIGTFVPLTQSPRYNAGGTPYSDRLLQLVGLERLRALITIDDLGPGFAAAYDLDTLSPLGEGIDLPGRATAVTVITDAQWVVVATSSSLGTDGLDVLTRGDSGIVRVGTLAIPAGLGSPDHEIRGLTQVPGTSLVFALASVPVAGVSTSGTMTVSLVDLAGVGEGSGQVMWTQAVPDCVAPVDKLSYAALGYVPEQQAVYFGCADAEETTTAEKFPTPGGVGRFRVTVTDGVPDQPGGFTLFPREGDFRSGLSAFDPSTGRLLVSAGRSSTGWSLFSFDTRHEAWVGALAVGPTTLSSIGIGPRHGRVYTVSPSIGLLAADIATTPLEQGRRVEEYRNRLPDDFSREALGTPHPLFVDDTTQRVFLPPYSERETNEKRDMWYVVQDDRAPYVEALASDPDAITDGIEEVPGKTGRTVSGSAQGYGTRTRQVGGGGALTLNLGLGDTFWGSSGGTREFATSFLDRMIVSNNEATAQAIAAERDATTSGDQGTAGEICNEDVEESCTPSEWPVRAARCADFGGASANESQDGSTVRCDVDELTAEATSTSGPSEAGGVGTSGSALTAEVEVNEDRGLVATVTASADGISFLGGAVTIGRVEARTEVVAGGRSGTATGSYQRSISDVTVAGQVICGDACDIDEVAEVINERFVGRARVAFPEPDAHLLAGSPGGAQAIAQSSLENHVQAVTMDEQDSSRREVAGMVLYLYQDKDKPSRTVYEFAGVQAEARYGVFSLGLNGGIGPGPNPGNGGSSGSTTGGAGPVETNSPRDSGGPIFFTDGEPSGGSAGDAPPLVEVPPAAAPYLPNVIEGVRGLVANAPLQAAGLFFVWLLMLMPVYLSARRSLFLRRELLAAALPAAGGSS